jgi:hypothetical protein
MCGAGWGWNRFGRNQEAATFALRFNSIPPRSRSGEQGRWFPRVWTFVPPVPPTHDSRHVRGPMALHKRVS